MSMQRFRRVPATTGVRWRRVGWFVTKCTLPLIGLGTHHPAQQFVGATMRLEFAPKLSDRETQFLDRLATLGCLDVGTFRRLERMLVETGERLVALVLKLGVLSEQRLLTELSALSGVDVLRASHLPDKAVVVPGLNL